MSTRTPVNCVRSNVWCSNWSALQIAWDHLIIGTTFAIDRRSPRSVQLSWPRLLVSAQRWLCRLSITWQGYWLKLHLLVGASWVAPQWHPPYKNTVFASTIAYDLILVVSCSKSLIFAIFYHGPRVFFFFFTSWLSSILDLLSSLFLSFFFFFFFFPVSSLRAKGPLWFVLQCWVHFYWEFKGTERILTALAMFLGFLPISKICGIYWCPQWIITKNNARDVTFWQCLPLKMCL